jgi:DNA repair protein RadC
MHQRMKDMFQEELPRERLWHHGPKELTNAELLAIILRTGTQKISAVGLASHLLSSLDGMGGLAQASLEELTAIHGVGKTKASQLIASFELAKRVDRIAPAAVVAFKSPEDVFRYVYKDLKFENREHFLVLALNTKSEIIGRHIVSVGTLNQTLVHPREVFNWAIKKCAAGIIIVHNHPSGHVEPSSEDITLTQRMVDSGELLGIKVIDHIIIGNNQYYSLKSNNKM